MHTPSFRSLAALAAACLLAACTGNGKTDNNANVEAQPSLQSFTNGDDLVAQTQTLADGSQLTWVKDNDGNKLNPRELFADAPDSLIESLGLTQGIPGSISFFLLKAEGKTILFDAGLGPKMGGHITERLATVGLTPDSIDMLYLTHLHPDHIGGMMGEEGPLFRNAQVYVGQVEYDAWIHQMPADKAGLQLAVMDMYAQQIHQFAFGDTLPCGVLALDAVGHTPGHTVFQHGELLIIGDLMHGQALQQEHPEYCANFDMDKAKAVESRRRILEYARANNLQVQGMHLPEPVAEVAQQ